MIYSYFFRLKHIYSDSSTSLFYIARVLASSWLLALSAQISFMLPISPVPFTLQAQALLFISLFAARKTATAAVLAYFAQGLAGLPVFASGAWSIWSFFSPSGGYLLGFLPAAWMMGACADRGWAKHPFSAMAAAILGQLMIYTCGLLGLSLFIPSSQLLAVGLYPFMPGILLQIVTAALWGRLLPKK